MYIRFEFSNIFHRLYLQTYSNMSTVCNAENIECVFMKAESIIQMDVTLPLLHPNYAKTTIK